MDEAGRALRARDPRVRVVRPQQPARERAGVPRARPRVDGPHVRRPVARGDGGGSRGLRGTGTAGDPLRLPLGVDPARGRRLRARHLGRRVPVPRGRVRDRRHRAVEGADPRRRARRALRRHGRSRAVPGAERLHRRQAQLGLRGRERAARLGGEDRARLAEARRHLADRPLAGSRPLPAAARRVRPGRRERVRRRRHDRADRADGRRLPRRRARDDVAR